MGGSGRVGEVRIFKGAHRAKLIKGIDQRVWCIAVVLTLVGMAQPFLWLAVAAVLFAGRIAGAKSPYFFDEVSVFLRWRLLIWQNVMPDDAYWTTRDVKFRSEFRKVKP